MFTLCACASLPTQTVEDVTPIETATVKKIEEAELDPNLPNVELDQATLEQILIQNFASYNGKWSQASNNSFLAAQSSRDYRLAQTATFLALRGNDYATAQQGAELWVELDPDSKDAVSSLIISQIGASQVDDALSTLDANRHGKEIDAYIKDIAGLVVQQTNGSAALQVMTDFVAKNPESAQVHLSGAYVAEVFKKYEQAQTWLDDAIALN